MHMVPRVLHFSAFIWPVITCTSVCCMCHFFVRFVVFFLVGEIHVLFVYCVSCLSGLGVICLVCLSCLSFLPTSNIASVLCTCISM